MSSTIACDRGLIPPAQPGGGGTARHVLVLVTCILSSSLAFVDGSVVNVGLPAVARSFTADAVELQWVVNAYLLPLSALLLLGGALGDRYGRRRLLVGGVGLFALGSAGCAAAPSLDLLLAARALQGAGAALLLPSSLAILGATFQGAARGRAVGTWAAASAMAGAIGPALGGWLIDVVGWRAIFLINLPLAMGAVTLAYVSVHEAGGEGRETPLDLAGAGLATLALGALVGGLTLGAGPSGWSLPAVATVGLGIVLATAFVRVEAAKGDRAMTPPALFGSRVLVGLNLMTFLLYGALGGFLVLFPYVLIEAGRYPATAAGAALLPFPLVMTVAGPIMGQLAGRFGSRWLLSFGPATVAVGFALAARLDQHADYLTQALPCVLVTALGMSAAAAPLTTAILASVDGRHTGSASGLNSAVARTGGLVATALIGGVLSARGAALVERFHAAALFGAALCLAAGACAFWALSAAQGAGSPDRPAHRT